jgi:putative photosynthetic complex assembly protein
VSEPVVDRTLPRGALAGAGILLSLSLGMVLVARLTGYQPAKPPASAIVESRDLRFVDRADGAVLVYASDGQRLVDVLDPGTNGFVRGVLRGLVRERRATHVGAAPPFRLTRWADGRLSLDDPSTGRHVDLEVFGPTNAGAFAQILVASGRSDASGRSEDKT